MHYGTNKKIRRILRKNPTPQEIILWSRIRRNQMGYKFRRQHSFGNYVVDFYCKERLLIIEIDGWQHGDEFSGEKEKERTKYLKSKGFKVLRFWNNEINNNLESVILRIGEYL
ncbi:MAG: endonuclease domain-containing protein [Candidatus Moraniibacteriota bacterium]